MPRKRNNEDTEEKIQRKIRKYQEKLNRVRRRSDSSPSPPRDSVSDSEAPLLQEQPPIAESIDVEAAVVVPLEETSTSSTELKENSKENRDVKLDDEILSLLGDAPLETKFGPPILKDLAVRWGDIIINGLTKEKRSDIKKLYLPPENCKTIGAPKLNLEAQAAVADMAVKRDKAISAKQNQIGCALTELAVALEKLCKNKNDENLSVISNISNAARLLCDHQHQESTTRRNFILQGLEQTTRDSVKDTEMDQWLFGENFAEKLKSQVKK